MAISRACHRNTLCQQYRQQRSGREHRGVPVLTTKCFPAILGKLLARKKGLVNPLRLPV